MLQFRSLYSGSSGNSLFVKSDNTSILVDCGTSTKKIINALNDLDVDISEIDAIIVTHEHHDHVQGLGTMSKKFDIPVFANFETWNAMDGQRAKIDEKNQKYFENEKEFQIGNLQIFPFSVPHDAANPCGFSICHKDKRLSIATDLGHVDNTIIDNLKDSQFMLLEANYDPDVLKISRYPHLLKQRISGPNGHLSNSTAGKIISILMEKNLKEVMLGHLSQENNFPELAYQTVANELIYNNSDINDIKISVASRYNPSQLVNL